MGLTGGFLTASVLADIAASTSSAGTMMERIGGRAQGQMSQGRVEILRKLGAGRKFHRFCELELGHVSSGARFLTRQAKRGHDQLEAPAWLSGACSSWIRYRPRTDAPSPSLQRFEPCHRSLGSRLEYGSIREIAVRGRVQSDYKVESLRAFLLPCMADQ
jgi:hypothetical protein